MGTSEEGRSLGTKGTEGPVVAGNQKEERPQREKESEKKVERERDWK